jgi:hypothetical protein
MRATVNTQQTGHFVHLGLDAANSSAKRERREGREIISKKYLKNARCQL